MMNLVFSLVSLTDFRNEGALTPPPEDSGGGVSICYRLSQKRGPAHSTNPSRAMAAPVNNKDYGVGPMPRALRSAEQPSTRAVRNTYTVRRHCRRTSNSQGLDAGLGVHIDMAKLFFWLYRAGACLDQ